MENEKTYYEEMLNNLGAMEDDLAANMAPYEAIEHMKAVIRLCKKDYHLRFSGLELK